MVMEAPTPQCVGLEFVRQYYTILNKAPWHLHRFYAKNSSFMHGGENSNREPIVGQNNIHNNIMSMNFSDCHAKILLIDSQATITDGVVIQVTGELSNRGNPMRRFMQTFVLAPQSEKKYYVHNDIFRYQDQVFNDDCGSTVDDGSEDVEIEDVHDDVLGEQQQAGVGPQTIQEVIAPPPSGPPPGVVAPAVVDYTGAAVGQQQQQVPSTVVAPTIHTQVLAQQAAAVAPPQQQQPSSCVVSAQDLATPAPTQQHQLQHHHSAPAAPHVPQQVTPPAQPSVTPSHIARQVESSRIESAVSAPAPAAAPQPPHDDSWSSPVEDWSTTPSMVTGNWEEPASAPPAPQQQQAPAARHHHHQQQRSSAPSPPAKVADNKKTEVSAQPAQPQQQPAPQQQPPQQRSYAGFFKSASAATTTQNIATPAPALPTLQPQQQNNHYQPQQQQQQRDSSRVSQQSSGAPQRDREQHRDREQRDRDQGNGGGFQRAGRGGRPVNNYRNRNASNFSESEQQQLTSNNSDDGTSAMDGGGRGGYGEERRRPPQPSVPDTQQIFVGNLPQSVREEELKAVFEKFGAISDVRINIGKGKPINAANGTTKVPVNHTVPNFGFVTFDDDQAVGRVLKARPITILGDHRLNIEEKKPKSKMGGEGGGPYGSRPGGMRPPNMHHGARGGFSRGGDGGRGPQRGGGGGSYGPQRR